MLSGVLTAERVEDVKRLKPNPKKDTIYEKSKSKRIRRRFKYAPGFFQAQGISRKAYAYTPYS